MLPIGVLDGGEAFARGHGMSTGTKLFCVSGHVGRPGVYEVPSSPIKVFRAGPVTFSTLTSMSMPWPVSWAPTMQVQVDVDPGGRAAEKPARS